MEKINRLLRCLIILPILCYRGCLRPIIKPCCRFYPSCSEYALLAINHYGIVKGLYLISYRLTRCHPWAKGGYDPVLPEKEKN